MVKSGEWYWLSMSWSSKVWMDRISFFPSFSLSSVLFISCLSLCSSFLFPFLFVYFCLSAFLSFFLDCFLSFFLPFFSSFFRSVDVFEQLHCTTFARYSCLRHLFTTGWNKTQSICHYRWQGKLVDSSHCIYRNIRFVVMQFKSVTSNNWGSISTFCQPLYFLSC